MKKSLMLAMALVLVASGASAAVLASDSFTYPDGSLLGNGAWENHSGTPGDMLVVGGEVVIQHGVPSEDLSLPLTSTGVGEIYASFDFSVPALDDVFTSSDNEYFAHFMGSGYNYYSRIDIVPANGAGDFTLGLSTQTSTAQAIWAADLSYDTVYHVVTSYNQDLNISKMWIDPVGSNPPYIQGDDAGAPGETILKFALRQSDSTENEAVLFDNLIIADACEDVFQDCPTVANEEASFGQLKSMFR